eukprot:g47329.t1
MSGILCVFRHCLALVLVRWVLELHCMAEVQGQQVPRIQLRLAGRRKKGNEGRVEVYYDGEWGTICDDDFSIATANVICKELGFLHAENWVPGAKYGRGKVTGLTLFSTLAAGRIWIDNVRCTGSEKSLAACDSNGWGVTDCKHTEDAGVVCSEQRVPGFRFVNTLDNNIEAFRTLSFSSLAILGQRFPSLPQWQHCICSVEGGSWECGSLPSPRETEGRVNFPAQLNEFLPGMVPEDYAAEAAGVQDLMEWRDIQFEGPNNLPSVSFRQTHAAGLGQQAGFEATGRGCLKHEDEQDSQQSPLRLEREPLCIWLLWPASGSHLPAAAPSSENERQQVLSLSSAQRAGIFTVTPAGMGIEFRGVGVNSKAATSELVLPFAGWVSIYCPSLVAQTAFQSRPHCCASGVTCRPDW